MCRLLLILLLASPLFAETNELAEVNRQLQELKDGQQQLRQELSEIRKLLQAPQPRAATIAATESVDFVLEIPPTMGVKGNAKAKVAFVEVSDYQCPFCGEYARLIAPVIERDYVKTGKIQYFFLDHPQPNHPDAPKAAEAARCAGEQGKYWEMHQQLFAHPTALGTNALPRYAEAIGLDVGAFRQCIESGQFADAINDHKAAADKVGLTATPVFVIGVLDGTKLRAKKVIRGARHPVADFQQAIDSVLTGLK
jgi:protein-disulfide isomerase